MSGYVVDIVPSTKWGGFLYAVKIMMTELLTLMTQNVNELPDWLWYGSAVKAEVSSVRQGDVVKFVVDKLSINEREPSIQPVQISVLSFDAQSGELTLRMDHGRILTIKVSEGHVKDELLTASEPDFYALFLDKPSGLKIISLIRPSKYKILSRAKELARSLSPP